VSQQAHPLIFMSLRTRIGSLRLCYPNLRKRIFVPHSGTEFIPVYFRLSASVYHATRRSFDLDRKLHDAIPLLSIIGHPAAIALLGTADVDDMQDLPNSLRMVFTFTYPHLYHRYHCLPSGLLDFLPEDAWVFLRFDDRHGCSHRTLMDFLSAATPIPYTNNIHPTSSNHRLSTFRMLCPDSYTHDGHHHLATGRQLTNE